jgi:hypothetical protein
MRLPALLRLLALGGASLVLAACATTAPRPPQAVAIPPPRAAHAAPAACMTCGRIERIDVAAAGTRAGQRGAVLGGVVGGVLAKPAPVVAGGAPASRDVRLVVLLDNGRRLILTQPLVAGMKVGARVRVDRSRAVLLH